MKEETSTRFGTEASGKRLNIILPEQTMARIIKLRQLTAASSVTDVIRTSILTYEALVEYLIDGNTFYLKNDRTDAFTPVNFLFDIKRKVES